MFYYVLLCFGAVEVRVPREWEYLVPREKVHIVQCTLYEKLNALNAMYTWLYTYLHNTYNFLFML